MTTADRLSARTVHTNPEHEDPHKDPKRTETSTVRGKPGRQRARRRHARCFPRPAARYQQRTVLKIQGASRSRAFGCRGFTSVCRSSASVLSPATRHVCPVCFASHSDARLRPSSTCTATPAALSLSPAAAPLVGCRSLTLGRSLTSVRSTASVSRNDTCLLQHPFAALPLLCRASPGIGDLYLCPLLREERVAR